MVFMSDTVAIYPGSFDPVTLGHSNIIERSLKIFDTILVVVAINSAKQSVLEPDERLSILEEMFAGNDRVQIDCFTDRLLIDYAKEKGANVIIRGLRTVSDYEYEFQMAHANRQMNEGIDTIFMVTESKYSHLSSTLIKEILSYGGSCKGMLDPQVEKALHTRLQGRR
jgi:pantetheine-phosphate adenylyltransferase